LWGQGMPVVYTTLGGRSSLEGLGIDVDTLLESGLMSARGEDQHREDVSQVQHVGVSLHGSRRPLQIDVKPLQQEMPEDASGDTPSSFDLAFPSPPPRFYSSPI
jgi:hypothetical protein